MLGQEASTVVDLLDHDTWGRLRRRPRHPTDCRRREPGPRLGEPGPRWLETS